jgi:CrcB protein
VPPTPPAPAPVPPRPTPLLPALGLVALGGAVGAAARYGLGLAFPDGSGFPWTILVVNVSGALVLGALLSLLVGRQGLEATLRPLVATGFIASYTTWSTYVVGVAVLVRDHQPATALAYLAVSLVAGLLAAGAGVAAGTRWSGPAT